VGAGRRPLLALISLVAQDLGLEGLPLDRFMEAAWTWRTGTRDERIS
jgi:hypothetical protein